MKLSTHVVITGGTIDSHYDGTKDTAVTNKESVLPAYFSSLRLYDKVTFQVVCMKDSRALGSKDRNAVLKAIQKTQAKHVLITHGTYTMPDTARYLKKHLGDHDKVILLTGSMIPLIGFSPSDAGFNLGFAFAKLHDLPVGIYVAMNGKIFTPEEVVKLLSEGRFSSILNK